MTAAAVRDRPILFSGPMIRAILDGKKTQTRRVVKPQPPQPEQVRAKAGIDFALFQRDDTPGIWYVEGPVWAVRQLMDPPIPTPSWTCPYGEPGERLWVRESFYCDHCFVGDYERTAAGSRSACEAEWREMVFYGEARDDWKGCEWDGGVPGLKPSIHMPRWASRLTLEMTDVRVQRVQEISEPDAYAEGIETGTVVQDFGMDHARPAFRTLWDSLNAKRGHSWESNPWVWCLTFRRVESIGGAA